LARSGKPDDLDAWVLATAPRAVAYAASLLRDRSRAEDVVQDCYLRLLRKRGQYDLPNSGLRLLFKAITRSCINITTREHPVLSIDGTAHEKDGVGWEPADSRNPEPAGNLMYKELQQAVTEALGKLPVLHRAALELKSLGHSQHEIGQMLEITTGHAGVLIHRARKAMAAYLAPFVGEATG
jgi:RNA polymerase sigma-70 factor (ECF subfamily)